MALHQEKKKKAKQCVPALLVFACHFHGLRFAHRHPKHAPTAGADTVCSLGGEKSADSQHKGKPILLRGRRGPTQGTTKCQVYWHQAISFHTSFTHTYHLLFTLNFSKYEIESELSLK